MDHIVRVRIPQIRPHAPFWIRKEFDKVEKLYSILEDLRKASTRGYLADYHDEERSS